MIWLILFIMFWGVCGVLSYGLGFAYWQRKWPNLAKEDYEHDRRWSAFLALLGPFTLIAYFVNAGYSGGKYGFKWK